MTTTSWTERLRRLGPATLERVEDLRPRYRALDAGLDLWDRDRSKAATLLAGALVYRLFVWMLPVALLLASLLGFIAAADPEAPSDLARDSGVGGYVAGLVGDAADHSRQSCWVTLAVAVVGLAMAGGGAVRALRLSHTLVWDVQAPKLRHGWVGSWPA